MPGLFDRFGRPKRTEAFSGRVYCGVNQAVNDDVREFTTESIKLLGAMIQAQDNDQNIGDADLVDFTVPAGSSIFVSHMDPSTLRVQNTNAGQNGTLIVLGTRQ